jgi:hypothetical protein
LLAALTSELDIAYLPVARGLRFLLVVDWCASKGRALLLSNTEDTQFSEALEDSMARNGFL